MPVVPRGLLLIIGFAFMSTPQESAFAQEITKSPTLRGRHSISIGVGLLPRFDAQPGAASARGILGSLSYQYWTASEWGIEAGGSLHDAQASTASAAAIYSIHLGVNHYPAALNTSAGIRPYAGLAIGTYIGSHSAAYPMARARTESVVGARVAGGMDVFATHWMRLGVKAAYHAAPDFDQPIGSVRNPSGSQLSFEAGITF